MLLSSIWRYRGSYGYNLRNVSQCKLRSTKCQRHTAVFNLHRLYFNIASTAQNIYVILAGAFNNRKAISYWTALARHQCTCLEREDKDHGEGCKYQWNRGTIITLRAVRIMGHYHVGEIPCFYWLCEARDRKCLRSSTFFMLSDSSINLNEK